MRRLMLNNEFPPLGSGTAELVSDGEYGLTFDLIDRR